MSSHITLASGRTDWRTPDYVLGLVHQVGNIDLDPCNDPLNSTGARLFYARHARMRDERFQEGRWLGPCGLAGSWDRDGLAYINPPYGRHLSGAVDPDKEITRVCGECRGGVAGLGMTHWYCSACGGTGRRVVGVGTGWAERIARDEGEWLAVVPVRTETAWWKLLHEACDWAVLWGSSQYGSRIRFVGPGNQPNIASTVFYHGPRAARFRKVFAPHGTAIPGERWVPVSTRGRGSGKLQP